MPISTEEKVSLDNALAAFDTLDSVSIGRLLYTTLLDAKLSPENPDGMGWKAISSLGRLLKDRAAWDTIKDIEAAVEAHIRLPLIKSTDTIFRARFASEMPKLDEEHKQALAFIMGKMDAAELANLTRLLYETVMKADMKPEAQDAFGKFYYAGYSWDDLKKSPEILKGILFPISTACHNIFRDGFANLFGIEEPVVETPPEQPTGDVSAKDDAGDAPLEPDKAVAGAEGDEPTEAQIEKQVAELEAEVAREESDKPPAEPMPVPQFASQEEIDARAKSDAEKPQFKGGKKKKAAKDAKDAKDAKAKTEAKGDAKGDDKGDDKGDTKTETKAEAKTPEGDAAVTEPPGSDASKDDKTSQAKAPEPQKKASGANGESTKTEGDVAEADPPPSSDKGDDSTGKQDQPQ